MNTPQTSTAALTAISPSPTITDPSARTDTPSDGVRRSFVVSAWAVPTMVVGQFAMLAIVPVVLVLRSARRDQTSRAVRAWAVGLGAAYTASLAMWAVGPDRERSLSKDMHPAIAALIVTTSLGLLATHYLSRRRDNRTATR